MLPNEKLSGHCRLPIYPQLEFAKIDVVIPPDSITGLVYMDVF